MFRKLWILSLMLIFSLLLSGCAPAARQTMAPSAGAAPQNNAPGKAAQSPSNPSSFSDNTDTGGGSQAVGVERLVIRNANLTILVADPGQAMNTVIQMTSDMKGYVVSSALQKVTISNDVQVPEARITVRVPAERLNEALGKIKGLTKDQTKDVLSENITGEDVTKEYTDLQSREKNLEAAEQQLLEIMKSTQKEEDVLQIFNQLTQVREQIEVLKGQIQYYQESAALSSIAIVIQAQASVQPLEIGGWQPVGVARDAVQTLIDTLKIFANIAIWLVIYVLPVGLIIFLPLRLLWWLLRRGAKNKKLQAPPTPPAQA